MTRTIWMYGGISGAVIIGSMIVTMNLAGTGSDLADCCPPTDDRSQLVDQGFSLRPPPHSFDPPGKELMQ